MNNLTVNRVLKAYEAGVVKPGFEGWGSREKECGCAITAVSVHEKPDQYPDLVSVLNDYENNGTQEICNAVDVTWSYMHGFTDAFDGQKFWMGSLQGKADIDESGKAQYHMGYEHGTAARVAVFAKYFPEGYLVTEGSI